MRRLRKKVFKIKAKEDLSYEETLERFGIVKSSLVCCHRSLEPKVTKNCPPIKLDMQVAKLYVSHML